jgi:peptidoglycan/xylan/chitin deacetylase (PgdA/CDA1 family)
MNTARMVLARLGAWVIRGALRLSRRRAGVILVYHALAERAGDPERELVPAHGVDQLEAQLRHLASCYRIVRLEELQRAVERRTRWRRFPIAITFDDDLASHLRLAAPVLERHSAHATFFLCGASLEEPHAFWWQRLQQRRTVQAEHPTPAEGSGIHEIAERIEAMAPYERAEIEAQLAADGDADVREPGLRSEDVHALVERGFGIGFHTLRHHRLTTLDDDSLEIALSEGRRELEEAAGEPIVTLAYPHGRADSRVAEAARAGGFRLGVTGGYEAVVPESDPMLLGRIEPTLGSHGRFAVQVARALLRQPHA